jgi:hypothetical protein
MKDGTRPALNAAADAAGNVMLATARAARTKGITIRKRQFTVGDNPAVNVRYGPNAGWVAIMNDRTQPHFIARRGGRSGKGKGQLRRQSLGAGRHGGHARGWRMLLGALGGAFGSPSASMAGLTRGAINIKGVGPRAYAFHPGNRRAKHFAGRGITNGEPIAINAYEKRQVANFAKPFR